MAIMPDIELLFGPMLIGVFLNTILYGVLVVQTFNYYQAYKKRDKAWNRYLLTYLIVLETIDTGCMIEMIYEMLIIRFARPMPPGPPKAPVMLSADAILTVLISTPVQLFLAWRVKVLSGSMIIPIIIGLLSICSFGGGVATTVFVSLLPEFENFPKFLPVIITWLSASAATDFVIAGSLLVALHRKRTGVRTTDDVISRIINFMVPTGLVTAVFALADIILVAALPGTSFNFIPVFALSKLYTNTFVAMLNARTDWGTTLGNSKRNNENTASKSIHFLGQSMGETRFTTIDMTLETSTIGSHHV